jgi:hypothetical protein
LPSSAEGNHDYHLVGFEKVYEVDCLLCCVGRKRSYSVNVERESLYSVGRPYYMEVQFILGAMLDSSGGKPFTDGPKPCTDP